MTNTHKSFKSGDLVEVLQPHEILSALDTNGLLDGLPFMPEMIPYCGKKFKVLFKVEKTCVACLFPDDNLTNKMKEFIYNDVVFLENLRCSGTNHGNCHRACMIFWKESWLKKVNHEKDETTVSQEDIRKLKERLITQKSGGKYFCQSTELKTATNFVSSSKRIKKIFKEISSGGLNIIEATKAVVLPSWRKFIKIPQPQGVLKETPVEQLNLEPGELVEIRPFNEILHTLNSKGKNKGLKFTLDMKQYCGKKFRVRNKVANMIQEETGDMLEIKNTVILEDVICTYPYRFAGCPRSEFHYWREIWLKRVNE